MAVTFERVFRRCAVGVFAAGILEARVDADSVQAVAKFVRWAVFVVLAY